MTAILHWPIRVRPFPASKTWYIPKKGQVLSGDYNRADVEETVEVYKLKNGKLKKAHTAYRSAEGKSYSWDGKTISKKTYDKKFKKAKSFGELKGFISKKKMQKKLSK